MMATDVDGALDVARALAGAGIPIFVALPDATSSTGFRLPSGWQQTTADPSVVDSWEPGMALGMVMGHGLDLLDVDPRSGGTADSLNGSTPGSYGVALTPSGGMHSFIRSLGVRSRDSVLPGIDVKAGDAEGRGRGFAFIAPTVRASKVTGQPTPYCWASVPDLTRLVAVLRGEQEDDTGRGLVELIEKARSSSAATLDETPYTGPSFEEMPLEQQQAVTKWVAGAVDGVRRELAASAQWSPGQTDDRGRGWEKLQADAALRLGRLARSVWNDFDLTEAETVFCETAPVDGTWGTDDVELKWRQQSGRLAPAAWPDLRDPADRDDEAWASLGVTPPEPASAPTGVPPGPGTAAPVSADGERPPPASGEDVAARYFGPGGIQAATLAGDVMALGPLRQGIDHVMWSYSGGVWSQDKKVVEARLTWLLGQRFRTNYTSMVEAVVRSHTETISCAPVPELINFTNGLLDWRTGALGPHDPQVASTVQLGVDYVPEADCPDFERFLHSVVPADVIETVWELIGYLMYSGNPLHKAVMLTGHGRNGKGTFLRVVETVLGGARNVTSISLHDLVNTRFATASLFGKLANVAGDIDATYMESTATFKGITGGDTISAEHKGRDRFDFKPWAVPMFSANKIPGSADTSVGYLSRWLVVPFPNSFAGREDRHLDARLNQREELQGIAARGVAALGGLLERGDFLPTASGEAAREEFVRRVDQVRTWLADCCHIAPEHPFVARTALYEAYKTWAFRDGHKPVKASEFYDRLESAGAEPTVMRGTRGFNRVRIIDDGGYRPGGGAGWLPQAPFSAPPSSPDAEPTSENAVPAPLASGAFSQVNPSPSIVGGAGGAGIPQPPYVRDACVGGLAVPAPPAPLPTEPPAKSTSKRGSAEASAKAAQKREEKRAAAVAEHSGARLELPALLTTDGAVHSVSIADADALLATITSQPGAALTVDVEHTGYPIGHEHYTLRTVQLGNEHAALVLDPAEDDQADVVRRHLAAAAQLHAHSATADLVPLAVAGLVDAESAWVKMLDTGILAKLSDPTSTGNDADLKSLSKNVLGDRALSPDADAARARLYKAGRWLTDVEVTAPVEHSGWAQVDARSETMVRYAASDVIDDAALARVLPRPAPEVLARERAVQQMTARVSHRGIRLDGEHVAALLEQHRAARAEHAEQVRAFGPDNPGSNSQVAQAFVELGVALPTTPAGKPSVAKGVIEPMRDAEGPAGELARAVLDYRHHNTALVLLIEPYHELVTRGDGRARPTIYTLGADTGRMSSSRPNVQQVSREGGMRACFTADPGNLLVSADFSGVELRVAAALSQDTGLAALMSDPDRDLHWEVARLAFGPQATKAQRYAVKRGVFGRIYGGGVGAVAGGVGVSHIVAQSVIDAMDALTPGLSEWSRHVREGVEAGRTQFATYAGRIVHLPVRAPHAAPNYCIQGTARELLIDALLRWRETRWGEATLFPVHDELVVQVPEDQAAEATAALTACMTTELHGVPIIAEASEPTFAWADSA